MANKPYEFKTTHEFRRAFSALSPDNQKLARETLKKFKANPFDPSLRPHKINRLSSLHKRTVHSITIDEDLKAVFTIKDNQVISMDIGTHDIYK